MTIECVVRGLWGRPDACEHGVKDAVCDECAHDADLAYRAALEAARREYEMRLAAMTANTGRIETLRHVIAALERQVGIREGFAP